MKKVATQSKKQQFDTNRLKGGGVYLQFKKNVNPNLKNARKHIHVNAQWTNIRQAFATAGRKILPPINTKSKQK